MNRKVYLIGEIEKRFGSEFSMNADSYADIIRCIDCNRPGFRGYLLECQENGVDFTINFAGEGVEEKDLLTPIKEGDVTIATVPAGSKSDGMKIVTAIVLFAIAAPLGGWAAGVTGVGTAATWGMAITSIGVSLAMQGIQGMLAPDPATDAQEEEGYLYQGGENIIVEGDPVPLLYGELRVAGQPISMALTNSSSGGGLTPQEEHAVVHATVGDSDNSTVTQIFNPQEQDVFLGESLGGQYP